MGEDGLYQNLKKDGKIKLQNVNPWASRSLAHLRRVDFYHAVEKTRLNMRKAQAKVNLVCTQLHSSSCLSPATRHTQIHLQIFSSLLLDYRQFRIHPIR